MFILDLRGERARRGGVARRKRRAEWDEEENAEKEERGDKSKRREVFRPIVGNGVGEGVTLSVASRSKWSLAW